MIKHILLSLILVFGWNVAYSDGPSAPLNIAEEDGSPTTWPYKLKVTNGTLTDNGDGTASLSIGGGGAPTDANYLVGTANGSLSAEIVVGTTPGGELGGTWASPTIDDSLTVDAWTLTNVAAFDVNVSVNVSFGTANDATIAFDGNSLNITANAVTAGDDMILTADEIQLTGETVVTKNARITAAPASDHLTSGVTIQLVANEAQAIGDAVYINADGEAQLGDADAIASSKIVALCADASIAGDATGNYLLHGIIRDDTWAWTVGGYVYLTVTGTTGNTLSQTAPSAEDDCIAILGVATHADRIYFNPQLVVVEHAAA